MTVEVSLRGVKCNLACLYCYQNPLRDAGAAAPKLDLQAVLRAVDEELATSPRATAEGFTMFGGDPLLAPLDELEVLWEHGLRRSGRNGIQTNGALIEEAHLEAFRRYQVHVGFSIDGPDGLNDARWAGSLERTREATARSIAALEACLASGIGASLIVTLHSLNARGDRLPRLVAWLEDLAQQGLGNARAHVLEVDGPEGRELRLTTEENLAALKALHRVETDWHLSFDVFKDAVALLRGQDDDVTCVWNACDPWTTPAVRTVEADGSRSNCSRVNKDGRNWQKGADTRYVRQLALYETPREDGGCQGCRFFMMCKGQCPGTAIGGDWRNRSADCETWMGLFEHLEEALVTVGERPASLHPNRAGAERAMVSAMAAGRFVNVKGAIAAAEGRAPMPAGPGGHGDDHGDHTDYRRTAR